MTKRCRHRRIGRFVHRTASGNLTGRSVAVAPACARGQNHPFFALHQFLKLLYTAHNRENRGAGDSLDSPHESGRFCRKTPYLPRWRDTKGPRRRNASRAPNPFSAPIRILLPVLADPKARFCRSPASYSPSSTGNPPIPLTQEHLILATQRFQSAWHFSGSPMLVCSVVSPRTRRPIPVRS